MEKIYCKRADNSDLYNGFFECVNCGNHVCKEQAELWGMVCPHCFGGLYKMN